MNEEFNPEDIELVEVETISPCNECEMRLHSCILGERRRKLEQYYNDSCKWLGNGKAAIWKMRKHTKPISKEVERLRKIVGII